ncbi:Uncharacterised protein [Salmonella enterica subsp. enterica serovar Bovismorbificans]|uniref:Uncharacterized protein n=1 Tax=Salmonella enterica subsp. enterica serovar Bovismorbificans TaxID=58097 RepID=A0A655EIK4_SALET|nr:Uncharacterised protein [Salmonella enterica subsp. enterica serovar Bovismorbificans]CNV23875.1 Uncharacterised protein [Salmonella enterica subsp. enterica serovar Bovismorbificans]CPR58397.1 Uncharacterised protein [Salmonella enterica subsp. enterica serovar Bovismorbificans]
MFAPIKNVDHRTYRRFTRVFLFPVFRFRNVFPQPEGEDNWQNANEKQRAPAPDRHHQAVHLRGNDRADGEAGNQKTAGFIA